MLPAKRVVAPQKKIPKGWFHFCYEDQIRALVLDGKKIWIGGLFGLQSIDWSSNTLKKEKVPSNLKGPIRIETMLLDASETLWIGHDMGLYSRDKYGKWVNHTSNLPDPKVLCLCLSENGELWVGTWRGIGIRDKSGKWRYILKKDGLPENEIRTIFQDSTGCIWIGSSASPAGGLVKWTKAHKVYYSTKDLLAHPNVTAMMEDKHAHLWIGSGFFDKGGVTYFPDWKTNNLKTIKIMNQKTGLAGNKGRSLYEDNQGNIWIGSELDGLTIIHKNGKKTIIHKSDGLIGNEVMAILQDPNGSIWLGQEEGLCKITKLSDIPSF